MPEPTFTSSDKNNKTKTLGQEIVEAVLAMTNRISHHHHHHQKHGQKVGDPSQAGEEDGPTNSVITLAGTNTGASMKGEMGKKMSGAEGENEEEEEQLKTYVNSNFQAINNSIMLGGSYSSNDPGVHLEVVDYMEEEEEPQPEKTKKKRKNKGKKIVEESSHSKEQRESD